MKKINYLNKKDQRYLFRIRVPADLRNRLGKKELKRSLKTADIQIAKRRVSQLLFLATTLFDKLRMNAHLTKAEVQELGREFYNTRLLEDTCARNQQSEQYPVGQAPVPCSKKREEEIAKCKHLLSTCDFRVIRPIAEKILKENNIPANDNEIIRLCETLLRAELEIAITKQNRDNAIFYGPTADPLFEEEKPSSSSSNNSSKENNTFCGKTPQDLMKDLISQRASMPKKEKNKFTKAAKMFEELNGSKDMSEYVANDAVTYRDTLLKVPTRLNNKFKNKSIIQAIEINNKRKKPVETLSAASINSNYISPLKQLFKLYHSDYGITSPNIFDNVRVNAGKKSSVDNKNARLPFAGPQLENLFSSPLFTGYKSNRFKYLPGNCINSTHIFWLPLFMALTGVRPNELGQAEISDIEYHHGYPCLNITNGTDDDECETEKRLKTSAARRVLPIHEVLIEKGFLKHVEKMKKQGHKRIFPHWTLASDNTYSANPSKTFNRKNGIFERLEIKSTKRVLYSLRHNFKDLLKHNKIDQNEQDLLMGHENSSASAVYGDPEIYKNLIEKVRTLKYQNIDFSIIPTRKH